MQPRLAQRCAPPPPPCRLARALRIVGESLGHDECFRFAGAFHFALGAGISIAIRAESAGRFRIERCLHSKPVVTVWSLDGEDEHLAGVVLELSARERVDEILDGDCAS